MRKELEKQKEIFLSGKVVNLAWNGFWSKVKPKDFPQEQYDEMRKAFICGFYSCFGSMITITDFTEGETERIFELIDEECKKEIKKFGLS